MPLTDALGDLQSKTGYAGNPSPAAPAASGAAPTSTFSVTAAQGGSDLGPNFPAFHVNKDLAGLNIQWGLGETIKYQTEGADNDILHGSPLRINAMQNKTMIEALRLWYQMDGQSLAAIQSALYNHGFFGKGDKKWSSFGNPDDTSFKAWEKALTRAARANKTIWQVLGAKDQADFANNSQSYYNDAVTKIAQNVAGGGSRRAPLQIRYSSPDDLKAVATKAAQDTLGYVPDQGFLDQFVKVYHGLEGGAQRKAYGGGNYTDPGNPEVLADKQARQTHAQAAGAHDVAQQFSQFLQVIGGVAQ